VSIEGCTPREANKRIEDEEDNEDDSIWTDMRWRDASAPRDERPYTIVIFRKASCHWGAVYFYRLENKKQQSEKNTIYEKHI